MIGCVLSRGRLAAAFINSSPLVFPTRRAGASVNRSPSGGRRRRRFVSRRSADRDVRRKNVVARLRRPIFVPMTCESLLQPTLLRRWAALTRRLRTRRDVIESALVAGAQQHVMNPLSIFKTGWGTTAIRDNEDLTWRSARLRVVADYVDLHVFVSKRTRLFSKSVTR